MLLTVLPWSTFWARNYFAETWPILRRIITNNFVRGAVSGLGIVNLVVGFADLSLLFVVHGRRDMTLDDGSGRPL